MSRAACPSCAQARTLRMFVLSHVRGGGSAGRNGAAGQPSPGRASARLGRDWGSGAPDIIRTRGLRLRRDTERETASSGLRQDLRLEPAFIPSCCARDRAARINRDLTAPKARLSKAVQWRFVSVHPLQGVKRSKEDTTAVVRFLHADEEASLRAALLARDEERRRGRISANEWRRERGYELLPESGTYTDHLTPIVFLAINTGLRRGELLQLIWEDVDLDRAILTVRREVAKSGKTHHVPLNGEAVKALRERQGHERTRLVFPGENSEQMTHLKSAWTRVAKPAKLRAFRFHDLRHTFASKLVQRGVDLNAVRELLGHSDFSLTLRYAHLAAENKAAAVAECAWTAWGPGRNCVLI